MAGVLPRGAFQRKDGNRIEWEFVNTPNRVRIERRVGGTNQGGKRNGAGHHRAEYSPCRGSVPLQPTAANATETSGCGPKRPSAQVPDRGRSTALPTHKSRSAFGVVKVGYQWWSRRSPTCYDLRLVGQNGH